VNGEKKKSGLIRKYGLNMSRQAFREKAADMGWVKVSGVCGASSGVRLMCG
jgi:small subunit ribosomal protein S29e